MQEQPKSFIQVAILAISALLFSVVPAAVSAHGVDSTASKVLKKVEESGSNHPVGFSVFSTTYTYKEHQIPYKVAIWYPAVTNAHGTYSYKIGPSKIQAEISLGAKALDGRFPIVFYSHGATGAGTSSFFICEQLARNGYIVAAPDFLDTVCVARIDETIPFDGYLHLKTNRYIQWLRQVGLNKAAKEGRSIYSYRPEQLTQVIEKVLSMNEKEDSILFGHIDKEKLALFGHSFGAWTSLLVAGIERNFVDKRVKAVVALSSPVNESVYSVDTQNDLASVHIPVLFEYGELEPGLGRQNDETFLFAKANRPKMLICIKNADHLSFSGGVRGEFQKATDYVEKDPVRRTIAETTQTFLDVFVKNDRSKLSQLRSQKDGIASLLTEL
ncbi:MAG: hypothetical protein K2X93_20005 [Candidatus Obscuribacterales bacterium]|nr:hypothetical protein [Candidatus Obscuribacterales bacterium]